MEWLTRLLGRRGRREARAPAPVTGTDADVPVYQFSDEKAAWFFLTHEPTAAERGLARGEAQACARCAGALEAVLYTTWGGSLWSTRPVVVDGWRCAGCEAHTIPAWLTPEQVTAILGAGGRAGGAGRLDEAEYHFRRVIASWPEYPSALMQLGSVYLDRYRAEQEGEAREVVLARLEGQVERHMRRAAACEGMEVHPFAFLTLGRIAQQRGEEDEALEWIERLRAREDASAEHRAEAEELAEYIQGRWVLWERGVERINPYVVLHGGPRAAPVESELRTGIADLEEFAGLHPEHWQSRWFLGKAYQALGEAEACVGWLRASYELDPPNENVARELCQAHLHLGQGTEAVAAARAALAHNPEDGGLLGNLALALLVAGEVEEAGAASAEACRRLPDAINHSVRGLVDDVAAGRRDRPSRVTLAGELE